MNDGFFDGAAWVANISDRPTDPEAVMPARFARSVATALRDLLIQRLTEVP